MSTTKQQSERCHACGAPMGAHEASCPECRSPRRVGEPEVNRVGLILVGLVIVGGTVGALVRVYLDVAR